jgi:hypothetical protein
MHKKECHPVSAGWHVFVIVNRRKNTKRIGLYPKGQFYKKYGIPINRYAVFSFVSANAVLVRKIDKP